MGNDDGSSTFHESGNGITNFELRLTVHTGRSFVQNEVLGVVSQGPRKGDQLLLSGGKGTPPLFDLFLIAVGQFLYKLFQVDVPRRTTDVFFANPRSTQTNIAGYGSGEEKDVLQNETKGTAKLPQVQSADVVPV